MEQNYMDSVIKYYSFIHFQGVRGCRTEERLEQMMERYPEASDAIPNLSAFKDGYGMLVRRDYIPTLQRIMDETFLSSMMDFEYPSPDRNFDSNDWGYPSPEDLYSAWFSKLDDASEIAIAFKEYCAMVTASANGTSFDTFEIDVFGGRTYSFLVGDYSIPQRNFFPDDEREREYQDVLNRTWFRFEKAPFLAPVTSEEAHVLDIGCGGGAWSFQVADAHPRWHVHGYDVSRIIPSDQPPNCYLYLDDCNLPCTDRDRFDFIHVRGMSVCVDDWPSLIQRCYRALKPGGYLEVKDVILLPRRYPGSIATPAQNILKRLMKEGARQYNRDFSAIDKVRRFMRRQGFVDISKVTKEWPLQARDRKFQKRADSVRATFIYAVQVLSHSLIPRSSERKEVCLVDLRKELPRSRTYLEAVTIYGRKPDHL